jgi:hypothetical protein
MIPPVDHADLEVKGLIRYFPTRLSRSLILTIVTLPFVTFITVISSGSFSFLNLETELEKVLIALVISLITELLLLLIFSFELILIIAKSRHSRIYHYCDK